VSLTSKDRAEIAALIASALGNSSAPVVEAAPAAPVAESPTYAATTAKPGEAAEYVLCEAVHPGPFALSVDGTVVTFENTPCQRSFRSTSSARAIDGVANGGHAPLFIGS
jgi:hypothetical protein